MKYKTKVVMTGCVGMAVSVLLLICSLWEQQPLTELSRPGKGADSVTEHLQVQIGEDKTPIDVTVAAVPYDRKEEQTRIREASKNLETIFLGQNTSLDHVTMDLHMPTQIWDSEVTVQWYLDSWKYLEPDGTLKNEGLEEPGMDTGTGAPELWGGESDLEPDHTDLSTGSAGYSHDGSDASVSASGVSGRV